MDRAAATLTRLVHASDRASLRSPSNGTRWENQQLLFHMLFGYLLIRRLRPLVILFGRLPDPASHALAAALNAAATPFHLINYLASAAAGSVVNPAGTAAWMNRTVTALHRSLDADRARLDLAMHMPTRWDPYFTDRMTMRDIYHYATQHFDHHLRQLNLPEATPEDRTPFTPIE